MAASAEFQLLVTVSNDIDVLLLFVFFLTFHRPTVTPLTLPQMPPPNRPTKRWLDDLDTGQVFEGMGRVKQTVIEIVILLN